VYTVASFGGITIIKKMTRSTTTIIIPVLLLLSSFGSSDAFTPSTIAFLRSSSTRSYYDPNHSMHKMSMDDNLSNLLLSELTSEKLTGLAKGVVITLLFGGGLIPSLIDANKSLVGTLAGKRRGGEEGSVADDYVTDSGASGPKLSGSEFFFASEPIPLVDIIAIMSRIQNADSIANWDNLPSLTEINSTAQWLPRGMFKENIRKGKFQSWPVDAKTGEPVGGAELEKLEKSRISNSNVVIGDAALDAVFDSWAWGASVATPDKVTKTLDQFLSDGGKSLDVDELVGAAIRGRSVTGFAALSFIFIQIIALGSLFVAPVLRELFNLDIGFGKLGTCDGDCTTLF